jgi:hypothetical protein
VPPLREVVVMVGGGVPATVIDRGWVVVWAVGVEWSVACTVNEDVPDPDGTPEIFPVEALSARPVGRAPEEIDHE